MPPTTLNSEEPNMAAWLYVSLNESPSEKEGK